MGIKKIGIYEDYLVDEMFSNHVVSQGWPDWGDLSFAYTSNDESRESKFKSFIKTTYSDSKAPHTFSQLLKYIKPHDIILGFRGNTIVGITEMPEDFIYYYDEEIEDYRNCLFPVFWIKWTDFCNDTALSTQGGQGVKGIENAGTGVSNIIDYIKKHWEKFKKENNIIVQPPECQEKLENLKRKFTEKQIESEKAFIQRILNDKNTKIMNDISQLLRTRQNIILQGAPGTGKTFITPALALSVIGVRFTNSNLMNEYNKLRKMGQIEFVTFHQSMDYEDFIEGFKPSRTEKGGIIYEVKDGVFKMICQKAKDNPDKNYVLIIDEINRGNVSKIFGELISLIETDKRFGASRAISARLPYSKDEFWVPSNLFIIGTMNTTDRSVGSVDYAIRRRFSFYTLKSEPAVVESSYINENEKNQIKKLFNAVKNYINDTKTDMDVDDLMVGHSYFMYKTGEDIQQKWNYAILPLLIEYFKDGICSKYPVKEMEDFIKTYGEK